MSTYFHLFGDLYKSRQLILTLAKNDFKTRYSGSYLGILWGFIQPIMTILVFWFVFQVGFRAGAVQKVPFILWLLSGMVPWFFYSDAWISATNSYFEYSYLVKKVVFRISIIPIVKILSSCFVHLFFIGVMILLYTIYGVFPSLYSFQIIYYSTCLLVLVVALSFMTSSIVLFFKDLGQILSVIIQFGMWMTPIMWDKIMLPENLYWLFRLNPIYYIVEGYRDAMINRIWFWNKIYEGLWFWDLTLIYLFLGIIIFKRLKPHFSDVL